MANEHMVWAVNAPVPHDPKLARNQTWVNTGGQSGIVGPSSLEVRAMDIPGEGVRVLPGGFAIAATPGGNVGYTSSPRQSYAGDVEQARTVTIRQNGSASTRTDVVGILINDPQVEGIAEQMTKEDWENHRFWDFHVIENAPANARRPIQFGMSRPFIPLARITLPANRADVRPENITDLRFLAVRFVENESFVQALNTTRNMTLANNGSFTELEQFAEIFVPQWATHMKLDGEIIGAASVGALVRGETVLRFNAGGSNRLSSTVPWRSEDNDWGRMELPIAGRIELTEQERGREGFFRFLVRITGGTGTLRLSSEVAHYRLRVTFEEAPVGALTGS